MAAHSSELNDSYFVTFDGDRLGLRQWHPQGLPEKVIIGTHGICGDSKDFGPLASFIENQQAAVAIYAYNTRSQGGDPIEDRRGDIRDTKEWAKDLTTLTRLVREKHPTAEIIWYGESMGSIITLNTAANTTKSMSARCDRVILSAPVINIKDQLKWWQVIALKVGSFLLPNYRIPLHYLSGGQCLEVTEGYSHDSEEATDQEYFIPGFTVRFLEKFGAEIEQLANSATTLALPVAIFHGGNDFFTSLANLEKFVAGFPNDNKPTLFHYPKAYHLMLYDNDNEKIFTDLLNWLNQ